MQFRSLVLMGLCAALAMAVPARAERDPAPQKTYLFGSKPPADDAGKTGAKTKKMTAKQKAKAEKQAKAKAAAEKQAAAKAKAAAEKLAAAQKADAAKKLAAKAKADAAAKIAKAKALESSKIAKARAAEASRLAQAKAAEDARKRELAQYASLAIAKEGNNGELRSDAPVEEDAGFFQVLFGGPQPKANLLPETRALDAALELKQKKKFKVRPEFEPQDVEFSGYPTGTIVIDTDSHFLYLVQSSSTARRYGIAVGKDGLQYKGTVAVGDKQEWPRWIPTLEMQKRDPKKYGQYKDGMPGGGQNPLGARAIYLYQGKTDTHLRIHGTIAPETIGTNASNGCFRMVNEHVMDLYRRVKIGTRVVVL